MGFMGGSGCAVREAGCLGGVLGVGGVFRVGSGGDLGGGWQGVGGGL